MNRLDFKIAARNFFKYPLYSLLNLAGLSLGIAASFIVLIYVHRQLTYDKQFKDADHIYRIATDFFNMGGFAKSQVMLNQVLATECKEVATATALDRSYQEDKIYVGSTLYNESGIYYIDSSFFNVFNYDFIEGNPQSLRADEVILSETLAKKFYGEGQVFGKVIEFGKEKKPLTIAGVFKENGLYASHLQPALFLSIYPVKKTDDVNWSSAAVYNYVKLVPSATRADLEKRLDNILQSKVFPASGFNGTFAQWQASNNVIRFFVQPLTGIYLHSGFKFEVTPSGNYALVCMLLLIGILIIFIAAINYINLTTARSSLRTKEVGIRKTMGAARQGIAWQFVRESVFFSLLAMVVAMCFSQLLLPFFSRMTSGQLPLSIFTNWQYVVAFVLFSLLTGFLAGIYPAFYLSAAKTLSVLKGQNSIRKNGTLRTGLVVFQFAIAIFLVIGSTIIYLQLQYMFNKDPGFEREGVIMVDNAGILKENQEAFKSELLRYPEVVNMSYLDRAPAGDGVWMYTYRSAGMDHDITLQTFPGDEHYLPTLGMHLVAGRNFDPLSDTDSTVAIINESAARELGLKDPIGAEINKGMRVVGVIRDFNYQSLQLPITSEVLLYKPGGYSLAIKVAGNNLHDFLDVLEKKWKDFEKEEPLQYSFLDEDFRELMLKETMMSKVIGFFTLLAMVIACLGLFGLASFTAEQRTKEIGIRKVLGAPVVAIVALLTTDFVKPILIAIVIAFPIAWWASHTWLRDYAYRIDIAWWIFALAAVLSLVVAWITVGFQAIKAAIANPVKSLRTE